MPRPATSTTACSIRTGELIAVFDADHAPARDFLMETVGYFDDDPRLFLVQTPHFFLNPDPVERNLRTFEKMPSENEMFYGIIQRGLDKWNASFFCGSAAVLRRKALEETNGFSAASASPRIARPRIALHSRGWNSLYVDKPLIAGLQPATFASFIGQRSRWAQGMMQILRFRFPALQARSLAAAAALLHVLDAVLAVSLPAHDLPDRAAILSVLRPGDIHLVGRRVPGLYAGLHGREHDDAELPLRVVPLAVDFRALRVCADRPPAARRHLGHAATHASRPSR